MIPWEEPPPPPPPPPLHIAVLRWLRGHLRPIVMLALVVVGGAAGIQEYQHRMMTRVRSAWDLANERQASLVAERARLRQEAREEVVYQPPPPTPPPAVTPTPTPSGPSCGPFINHCPAGFSCTERGTCENTDMVFVPPGPFQMGCNSDQGLPCDTDEYPYHRVELSAYAIDRTEVTVRDYQACMAAGACTRPKSTLGLGQCNDTRPGHEDHPINCVDWRQAMTYCAWRLKRLPTEAEWEKAARGTDGRRYPWGDEEPDCRRANIFWHLKECVGDTSPVGSFPAGSSPYGALDLLGNALEWVNDWYNLRYYYHSPDRDPDGPTFGPNRVLRGSSSGDVIHGGHHTSARYNLDPGVAADLIGFRCAASLPLATPR